MGEMVGGLKASALAGVMGSVPMAAIRHAVRHFSDLMALEFSPRARKILTVQELR